MTPAADRDRLDVNRVLAEEYAHLHPGGFPGGRSATAGDGDVVSRMRGAGHVALCLSGGGIRSASFALGVIQRLAQARVLDRVDYLSTVSGGGYIGGWLSAWMTHAAGDPAAAPVPDQLRAAGHPGGLPEPAPVTQVRRYSRYLTPRPGVLSADVWTVLVTIARNLLLNWLILLPLLAAVLLIPRVYVQLVHLGAIADSSWWWTASIAAVGLLLVAVMYAWRDLPSLGNAGRPAADFLRWCLVPVAVSQMLLSLAWAWQVHQRAIPVLLILCALAALIAGAPWLLSFRRGRWQPARVRMFLAAVASGALAAAALLAARHTLAALMIDSPVFGGRMFAAIDVPVALVIVALGAMLFTGLASRDMTDDDREWWARAIAWASIAAACWAAVSVVVLFSLAALERLHAWMPSIRLHEGWGQLALSVATLLLGGAATDAGRRVRDTPRERRSAWQRTTFGLAAPAFAFALFVALAVANEDLLDAFAARRWFDALGPFTPLIEVVVLAGLLAAAGLLMDLLANINRFSLHGMYRDRIVRTFLGASRPPEARRPHAFTGLDPDDNLPLGALARLPRPLHIVNATLNETASTRAGWQERRGQPFTFSALHCGSAAPSIGFRRTEAYAGGVTLGGALAISGAAVGSSMGDLSSPPLTFLLTMFNARLGVWLGNPNNARAWRRAEPAFAAGALLNELVGRTTATRPYVYLTDGEHFDNLGLYEMVRRRCRTIVVCDAGCDPAYAYEDLATAIRKVRLDFGVPIEFPEGLETMAPSDGGRARSHHAIGRVRYSAADASPPDEDGTLVYLKATVAGDEPVDVLHYAAAHPAFPHQSTVDQWFGEADFEAYRALGWVSAGAVAWDDDG
jgi:hypothetical protein